MRRSAVALMMLSTVLLPSRPTLEARADTSLVDAVKRHDAAAVEALLTAGADVDAAQPDGATALHWAVHLDDAPIVDRLLVAGATVDATNEYGVTPLSIACGNGNRAGFVRALLDHGADPDARLQRIPPRAGYSQLRVEHRVAGVSPFPGATAFLLAAMAADVEVMRVLAEAGANPNLAADDGTTPLMLAAGLGRYMAETFVTEARSLQAAALALDLGTDVDAANETGSTALHGAAHVKSDALVRLLVEHGASLDPVNARGQTPLAVAELSRAGSATTATRSSTGDLLRALGARAVNDNPPGADR